MSTRGPADILSFIGTCVRGLDDLHLFVAMAAAPDRWWDADIAARELLIDRRRARAGLEHLAACNLLDIRVTGDIRYQFRPGTPALRDQAAAVLAAYRDNPIGIIRLASEPRGQRSMRAFADAFRLRHREDESAT